MQLQARSFYSQWQFTTHACCNTESIMLINRALNSGLSFFPPKVNVRRVDAQRKGK